MAPPDKRAPVHPEAGLDSGALLQLIWLLHRIGDVHRRIRATFVCMRRTTILLCTSSETGGGSKFEVERYTPRGVRLMFPPPQSLNGHRAATRFL